MDASGPPANIPDWSAPSAELLWTLRTHTHTSGSHQHPLAFAGGKRRLGWAARVWHRVCMCVRACAHLRSPSCHAQHPPCLLRVAQTRRRGGTWSPSALTRGCSRMCARSGLTHSVSHGGDPAVLMRTGVQHTEAGVHATGRQPLPYSETTLQEVTRSSGRSAKAVGSGRRRRQTWMKGSVGCPARPDA